MSRSGYSEDCDGNELWLWRGAVKRAITGKRGQKALTDFVSALDALPVKALVQGSFTTTEGCCSLGALAKYREVDVSDLNPQQEESDPYYADEVDRDVVSARFDIAPALAAEIMFLNDEAGRGSETGEERWGRMRCWATQHIVETTAG